MEEQNNIVINQEDPNDNNSNNNNNNQINNIQDNTDNNNITDIELNYAIANSVPTDNRGIRVAPEGFFANSQFNRSRQRTERRQGQVFAERINLHRLINNRRGPTFLGFETPHQLQEQDRINWERSELGAFDTDGGDRIVGRRNLQLTIQINVRDYPVFQILDPITNQWISVAFPDPDDSRLPQDSRIVLRALFQSLLTNHLVYLDSNNHN